MNNIPVFDLQRCGIGFLLGAILCATARADDTEYRIQWLHPRKVGDQQRVREVVDQTIESVAKRSSGEQRKTSKRRIEFAGHFMIQEVDDHGAPSKVRVTIDKATARVELAAPQELAKNGTVVVADIKDGKATLVVDPAVKMPPDGQGLLTTAIAYPFVNEASLEDTLGVVEPQRVGGSWSPNATAIVKRIATDFDPKLETHDIKGTAKLFKVAKGGEKGILNIEYQYRADSDRPFTAPGVATAFSPGPSVHETQGTAELPADLATGPTASHVKIRVERKFKSNPAAGERDKSPIDNLLRSTDIVDLRIDYINFGGPTKKPASGP